MSPLHTAIILVLGALLFLVFEYVQHHKEDLQAKGKSLEAQTMASIEALRTKTSAEAEALKAKAAAEVALLETQAKNLEAKIFHINARTAAVQAATPAPILPAADTSAVPAAAAN